MQAEEIKFKNKELLFMTHMPFPHCMSIITDLYNSELLDHFNVEIRPPLTACSLRDNGVPKIPEQLCVTFANRSLTEDWYQYALSLLSALIKYGAIESVILKTDMKGFEINKNGTVVDSWDLDDGMC
jgi:hypothetical protein